MCLLGFEFLRLGRDHQLPVLPDLLALARLQVLRENLVDDGEKLLLQARSFLVACHKYLNHRVRPLQLQARKLLVIFEDAPLVYEPNATVIELGLEVIVLQLPDGDFLIVLTYELVYLLLAGHLPHSQADLHVIQCLAPLDVRLHALAPRPRIVAALPVWARAPPAFAARPASSLTRPLT